MNNKIYSLVLTLIIFISITSIYVFAKSEPALSSRDYLLGWYEMKGEKTLIPVLKINGTYYSVCRGFEVPLKVTDAGLEWGITPSSMTGTTIGYDPVSKRYYIAIKDSQASNFSDGRYGIGEKQYLTKVQEPKGILSATSQPPRNLDEFLGWYQPVWFPWVRIEIRKDGNKYLSIEHELNKSGVWELNGDRRDLTPLPDKLGFTGFDKKNKHNLAYNKTLQRFELIGKDNKTQPDIIRNPLARIPAPPATEIEPKSIPMLRIGIPSWH
ncbi:MAG: hypothetical protein ACE14V_07085 [bacterium]